MSSLIYSLMGKFSGEESTGSHAIRSQLSGREYAPVEEWKFPEGSYAVVSAIAHENIVYVLKSPKGEQRGEKIRSRSLESIAKEREILTELNEKDPENRFHIVRLVDVVTAGGDTALVLEEGGEDLHSFVRENSRISLSLVQEVAKQILGVLNFLKEHDVVNRDVKMENLLKKGRVFKMIDFGLAFKGEAPFEKSKGTVLCWPPEAALGHMLTSAIDVWALGCVLFEAYTGAGAFPTAWKWELMEFHELRLQRRYPEELVEKSSDSHYEGVSDEAMDKFKEDSLESYMRKTQEDNGDKEEDFQVLWSVVSKMLIFDPASRIKPADALAEISSMNLMGA